MEIKNIAIHHSGGLGQDNFASTRHLTFANINSFHKQRWNFLSSMDMYAGYNAGYDPKTRQFIQWRAIGEETASQKGYNHNTFSLCIIGNYNAINGKSVDPMTIEMERDIARYLSDLIHGNKRNLVVASGTKVNLSMTRIYPHRFFGNTMCYGTGLIDSWGRNLLTKYKVKEVDNDIVEMQERLALYQQLLQVYLKLLEIVQKYQLQKVAFGAVGDRECSGNFPT